MVMTFFFVSYNKGDWVRRPLWMDAFQSMEGGRVKGRRAGGGRKDEPEKALWEKGVSAV